MAPHAHLYSAIIVGAGISGILAGKTLHDAGIDDFLILEATPRIGGRIHKAEFGGETVELGADWIHVADPNLCTPHVLQEVVKKINLNTIRSTYKRIVSHVYKQEGGLYEEEEVDEVLAAANDVQLKGVEMVETFRENPCFKKDMSISEMQKLYSWKPTSPLEMVIDYYLHDFQDGESPQDTHLSRTLPRLEYEDFGDDQYSVADRRGYETIVHHFARHFLSYNNEVVSDPRIKLNKVVTEISYTNDGVIVKTEDGSMYHAKASIVSVSLGVLKNDLIKFMPKLPEWKEEAISGFSMASYTRIFLKFPNKFWPTGPRTEFFLYAHERRGYYPVWKHYENEMPGSNILQVITSGEESDRIEEQCDSITKSEAMQVLRKIYGANIPEACDILVSKWKTNKYYNGSFSNWPPNFSEELHAQLRAPVASIYFTGEHTNPNHLGCVEGAYNAGCTTGEEVIEYLRQGWTTGKKLIEFL